MTSFHLERRKWMDLILPSPMSFFYQSIIADVSRTFPNLHQDEEQNRETDTGCVFMQVFQRQLWTGRVIRVWKPTLEAFLRTRSVSTFAQPV